MLHRRERDAQLVRAQSTHLAARALDVNREDAKLAEAAVLSLRCVANELVVHDINLKLQANRLETGRRNWAVLPYLARRHAPLGMLPSAWWQLHPVSAGDLGWCSV